MKVEEVGEVLEVGDGIARIYGLTRRWPARWWNSRSSETGETVPALALNLEEDNVGVVILGDYSDVQEGDRSAARAHRSRCRSAKRCIGRVVDALGQPIDGKGPIDTDDRRARSKRSRRASSSASR